MKFRKWLAILLILCLSTCMVSPTLAAETETGDEAFEAVVAQIMTGYADDPDGAVEALAEIDVALIDTPTVTTYQTTSTARGRSPSNYTLTVYAYKRGGSSIYYLQWSLSVDKKEWYPGPLDYVSLEWDTENAKYYGSSGDGDESTVAGKSDGIVLFNLEDDNLAAGDSSYGTVQVTRKGTGSLDFGSKFTHTYTSFGITGSVSYTFKPSSTISAAGEFSLGLSYTYGYTVTISTGTTEWSIWADNTVSLS